MSLLVVAACATAALLSTWSLSLHFTTTLPLGTEHTAIPPVFSLWNLWWVADRALSGFRDFWQAPIFHPAPGALAFSEPLILPGLLVAGLWRWGVPPAAIHNAALLTLLTVNGLFAYRLGRTLGAPRSAAVLGALSAVSLPFVGKHLGVMSVIPIFGVYWTLDGCVRLSRSGGLRDAIWACVGYTALFLSSQQLALLFLPFGVAAGLLAVVSVRRRIPAVMWMSASALAAGLAIAAIVHPARVVRSDYGFERSEALVAALSATPLDFLLRPETALMPLPPPALPLHGDPAGLFPGVLLLLLAAIGLGAGARRLDEKAWAIFLAATVAGATLLSFGLNLSLGDWQPFATLRSWIPEVRQLRAPYRFAGIAQSCLVPLATIGLAHLLGHRRAEGSGRLWAPIVGSLAVLENLCAPVPLVAVPQSPESHWARWLEQQPRGTPVVHVPLPAGLHVSDYEIEAPRLFAQLAHRQPLVNGFSSFFPSDYTRLQLEMAAEFPSPRLLCILYRIFGARLLIADRVWSEKHGHELDRSEISEALELRYSDSTVRIFTLHPPARCIDP